MRVAALTMVYNEPVWASVWARHYAAELGAEHCVMLDHGSDDGSTAPHRLGAPIRVERLPRSPLDEEWRLQTVSARVRALLDEYDAVLHSDVDELLVADPTRYPGLRALAAGVADPVVTAVGLDVHHMAEEAALDPAQPLAGQRRWVRFAAAMCKPALVRHPVAWCPGFHSSDAPLALDGLYLLHMRYADLDAGLRRLARTREQAFAGPEVARHQRVSDAEFAAMLRGIAVLPRRTEPLDPAEPPLRPWLDRLRQSRAARETERYKLDLALSGDELWDAGGLLRAVRG